MTDSSPSDYTGRPHYEKKFYKTHFSVDAKFPSGKNSDYIWVRTGVGRYRRVKKTNTENAMTEEIHKPTRE